MKDYLNQNINIGDKVVYGSSRRGGGLYGPYEVVTISKMVGIIRKYSNKPSYVSPNRLVVVTKLSH